MEYVGGDRGLVDNAKDKQKTLFQPLTVVLEAVSEQKHDSLAHNIDTSHQQHAVLSLDEFCKITLLYLNPENTAFLCGFLTQLHSPVYYYTFNIYLEISSN